MRKGAKPKSIVVPNPLLDIIAVCLAEAGRIGRHPLTGNRMQAEIDPDVAMSEAKASVERLFGVGVVEAGHRPDRQAIALKRGRQPNILAEPKVEAMVRKQRRFRRGPRR